MQNLDKIIGYSRHKGLHSCRNEKTDTLPFEIFPSKCHPIEVFNLPHSICITYQHRQI